jgi:hypothetical protein
MEQLPPLALCLCLPHWGTGFLQYRWARAYLGSSHLLPQSQHQWARAYFSSSHFCYNGVISGPGLILAPPTCFHGVGISRSAFILAPPTCFLAPSLVSQGLSKLHPPVSLETLLLVSHTLQNCSLNLVKFMTLCVCVCVCECVCVCVCV